MEDSVSDREAESERHEEALQEFAARLETRQDFAEFLQLLAADLHKYPETWDNSTVSNFLNGMIGYSSSNGHYKFWGIDVDPQVPSWRVFADILMAGRVYD